ncbi:5'-nucleotidase [Cristinia sonorae]|uniref:5'-nucleotidase n=1 Tax=Cristinia sonorae TaxID=1940300 RepID=A0A8K0UQG9_9AGAR|nr:5'-nucleotidase [Cristinia sonorae]
MKFTSAAALVLGSASLFLPSLVSAEAEVQVDRLVSKRYAELEKRDSGYANGGNAWNTGPGFLGIRRSYPLTFYHINDVHAHLDEFRSSGSSCTDPTKGCVGGYSRVKTVIDKTRPTKKNSLFLNAGDEFQGTLFYTLFKGEKISNVLNQLGFDAMTLGNHEFDDGDDLLAAFLHNLTFPIISSNVHSKNKKLASALIPYKIFHKHQLAVIAVTTETTASISNPSNLTTFEDPVEAAVKTVKHIKRTHPGIDRIVALTHIGYDEDIALAKATTDISLIIGGHSHTLLGNDAGAKGKYPTIVKNKEGEEVFVVTSYRWGEYVGYIDVEFDRRGRIVKYEGAPIHLLNTTAEAPKLKNQIKEWSKAFDPFTKTVLGRTEQKLVQSTCQSEECTLGDFSADSMEDYRPTAVAAIINAGGIRSEIEAGNITQQQALECFPFGNSIAELDFTGADLWDIFEGIVSKKNLKNGQTVTSFVQVSRSIRFTYNPNNAVGSRLITLSIKGEPIDLAKTYRISTLDYLATGGDSFWPARTDFATLDTMDVVWADYVKAKSPINYNVDGRIATTTETTPRKGV